LVVDPPDGRVPPLTPHGKAREAALAAKADAAAGPQDATIWDRCIVGFNAGPPMIGGGYNAYVQIFQTPDYVVLLNEMVHDARIIPLDGRPSLPSHVRQWRGDSRGRWDGDTLVVDTTNYSDKVAFRGSTDALHVVERFTRVDGNRLRYQFTIEDPGAFTQPWSGETYFERTDARMFEYACHEGNRSMELILTGGQAEQAALRRRKLSRIGIAGGAVLALAALGYAVRRRRSAAAEKIS
jgi:hypothetical protein